MKILLASLLLCLGMSPSLRFENDGVRVGAALVRGDLLELRGDGGSTFLVSGSALESLSADLPVQLAENRPLFLEPGIRVTRADGAFLFSTHGSRKIRFTAKGETLSATGPVRVSLTAEGWEIGEGRLAGLELRAGLQQQDDVDRNLDRMQEESNKLRTGGVPKLSLRIVRRYLGGNPLDGTEAAGSVGVRLIGQISPSGAP